MGILPLYSQLVATAIVCFCQLKIYLQHINEAGKPREANKAYLKEYLPQGKIPKLLY